jgi:hypothetical protein
VEEGEEGVMPFYLYFTAIFFGLKGFFRAFDYETILRPYEVKICLVYEFQN